MLTDGRREFYEDRPRKDLGPNDRGQPIVERGPPPVERGQAPIERGPAPIERGAVPMERGQAPIERGQVPMERGMLAMDRGSTGGRMTHAQDQRERSPFFDDRGSTGSGPALRSSVPQSFNGSMAREMEKGALGLPQDKMALVREKKEEIEKVC